MIAKTAWVLIGICTIIGALAIGSVWHRHKTPAGGADVADALGLDLEYDNWFRANLGYSADRYRPFDTVVAAIRASSDEIDAMPFVRGVIDMDGALIVGSRTIIRGDRVTVVDVHRSLSGYLSAVVLVLNDDTTETLYREWHHGPWWDEAARDIAPKIIAARDSIRAERAEAKRRADATEMATRDSLWKKTSTGDSTLVLSDTGIMTIADSVSGVTPTHYADSERVVVVRFSRPFRELIR